VARTAGFDKGASTMTGFNRGLALPTVAMLPIWFVGCRQAESGAPKPLTVNPQPYIADVPIPAGFEHVRKRSFDVITGEVRVVRHEYEGRAHPVSVRNFFREQMPRNGWTKLTDNDSDGNFTIFFEKEGEACTLEIQSRKKLGFPKTIIRVNLSPRDRSAAALAPQNGQHEAHTTPRTQN
jgi:hypothetical protein